MITTLRYAEENGEARFMTAIFEDGDDQLQKSAMAPLRHFGGSTLDGAVAEEHLWVQH